MRDPCLSFSRSLHCVHYSLPPPLPLLLLFRTVVGAGEESGGGEEGSTSSSILRGGFAQNKHVLQNGRQQRERARRLSKGTFLNRGQSGHFRFPRFFPRRKNLPLREISKFLLSFALSSPTLLSLLPPPVFDGFTSYYVTWGLAPIYFQARSLSPSPATSPSLLLALLRFHPFLPSHPHFHKFPSTPRRSRRFCYLQKSSANSISIGSFPQETQI